ncbi:MAG TPA: carboxypeptidase-like regulatory domain-containing protein [Flavisolibacter sp.]|nr:carboxypeptidase-like regulatory domain-containing protein [Flavisolibacter sp.]
MKRLIAALFISSFWLSACANSEATPQPSRTEKGIVKGRVTDGNDRPIAGAKVVIENTVFYASYVYATTNADGYYSAQVPAGSWKASVRIEKKFAGKTYRIDLHPDDPSPFAGTKGAVRNFVWRIKGPRPEGGFYGSDLAVYNEPGTRLLLEDVIITLTPVGELINGGKGGVIQKSLVDIGGGEDGIQDIPLGQYEIRANNKSGKKLLIRLRNKGDYKEDFTAFFEAGLTGVTQYKIVVQVKDPEEQ